MLFKGLRSLIPLKVQVASPQEPVARDWMAGKEEGDGSVGLHAVLTPLVCVSRTAFLSLGL